MPNTEKVTMSLRSTVGGESLESPASMLDRYRAKHGREEELIIKALLLLGTSLTLLYVYIRYNVVGTSGKKL